MKTLTDKEAAELRRLDRKIKSGKAVRREILRGIELKRRKGAPQAAKAATSAGGDGTQSEDENPEGPIRNLCQECDGFGYHMVEESDERMTCSACGGDGLRPGAPGKVGQSESHAS